MGNVSLWLGFKPHVLNLNLGILLLKGEEENGQWGTTSNPQIITYLSYGHS